MPEERRFLCPLPLASGAWGVGLRHNSLPKNSREFHAFSRPFRDHFANFGVTFARPNFNLPYMYQFFRKLRRDAEIYRVEFLIAKNGLVYLLLSDNLASLSRV